MNNYLYKACPFDNLYFITKFMEDNKVLVGIVFLVFGLLLAFVGAKFFWITIIILLCCIFNILVFLLYMIFGALFDFGGNGWTILILFIVGCSLGISIGLCLKALTSIFFIGIGAFVGYFVQSFLYNLFLNNIHSNPEVVYWVSLCVLVLIGAIIGYNFLKVLFIFTTSFVGSYVVIKGISLWAGGFPSESLIIDLINKNEFELLKNIMTGVVYAYLAGWVVLTALSMYAQFKANEDKTDDDFRSKKE